MSLRPLCCAVLVLAGACVPYTMMDFHRETLDPRARALLDCEHGALEVVDETPEGFRYGDDPEAGRYLVRACGHEDSFICYQMPEANVGSPAAECRRLGDRRPAVHLGPLSF